MKFIEQYFQCGESQSLAKAKALFERADVDGDHDAVAERLAECGKMDEYS